jgi:hypothetical protein
MSLSSGMFSSTGRSLSRSPEFSKSFSHTNMLICGMIAIENLLPFGVGFARTLYHIRRGFSTFFSKYSLKFQLLVHVFCSGRKFANVYFSDPRNGCFSSRSGRKIFPAPGESFAVTDLSYSAIGSHTVLEVEFIRFLDNIAKPQSSSRRNQNVARFRHKPILLKTLIQNPIPPP